MIKTILTRLKQGHRTLKYPVDTAMLSDRYLGRPEISDKIEKEISPEKLNEFIENCPVNALSKNAALNWTRLFTLQKITASPVLTKMIL
jgi:hypothetical protein